MKKKNLYYYLFIFLFTFTYFYFYMGDVYYVGDDTIFHTSNILVMADKISLFYPVSLKIVPTLVNNLGYGVNIFYPSFPHIVGSYIYKFLSLFGFGIAFAMKVIHFMVIFLSGAFMYHYVYKVFGNRKQALLSSIMYQSMPYLFTDVFMRGAFNESFLFMYLPLIFLSFHYLFTEDNVYKFYLFFIIGYSLFIYSHLVLSVYLTILLIPFLLVFYRKFFTKKVMTRLVIASGLVLLVTSNFWVPLVSHHLLENYYILTLKYYDSLDVKVTSILYYFFPLKFLKLRPGYYLLFFISPLCLFFMFCNYFLKYKKMIKKEHFKVLLGLFLFMIISIVLASSSLVWKFVPNLLKNIQFAWRLSLFVAFGAAVIGGYGIRLFHGKIEKVFLVISIIFFGFSNYYLTSKLFYQDIDGIEFLKDSCCSLQWSYEYLPNVAKYNSLYLYNKRVDLNIPDHLYKIIVNDVPNMKFEIFDIEDEVTIEFPRIYYLGYVLTNEFGEKIDLYQNSFGLLSCDIKSDGIYELKYKGTILDRGARVFSIITILVLLGYFLFYRFKK